MSYFAFHLEQAYQQLRADMQRSASAGWKLARVATFLNRFADEPVALESYVLELDALLQELTRQFVPLGWTPTPLHRLTDRLACMSWRTWARPNGQDAHARERTDVLERLRQATARLYAYGGAPERALLVLQGHTADALPQPAAADRQGASPRERLRRMHDGLPPGEAAANALETILNTWTAPLPERPAPIVESLPRWMREDAAPLPERVPSADLEAVGGFVALQVDLFNRDRGSNDITLEGYATIADGPRRALLDPVQAAVHAYLKEHDVALARTAWDGRVRLTAGPPVVGDSLQLALAVHLLTERQRAHPTRVRLEPHADVAFTGTIAADGTVHPVAAGSLPTKVQTAFFSPVSRLAVPYAQRERAEAARDVLRMDYPHGDLEIVGVAHLCDVYRDRALTRRVETGRLQHAARVARARSTLTVSLLSTVVIAALLAVIGWMVYGPIDKNPVAVSFGGEHMFLENANGQVVDRVRIGSRAVERHRSGERAYTLVDADGNEQNEICWVVQEDPTNQRTPDVLRCRGVDEETEQWAMLLRFDAPFPQKPEVRTSRFRATDLQAGDLDADGRPELYLTAHHRPYFPSVLLKVDPATGEELQRYVHPGYTQSISHYDLNGDGIQELLVPGTSNAFWEATLAVLDPRDMHGHAPTRGDYVIDGLPRAHHIAYVRFPPTKVHAARTGNLNIARGIASRDSPQQFTVRIDEGTHEDKDNGLHALVHFTADLEPQAVGTSSEYDVIARRLVETGQLDAVPDYDYFEDYMTRLQYWTGDGWTTEPTVHWPAADSSRARE